MKKKHDLVARILHPEQMDNLPAKSALAEWYAKSNAKPMRKPKKSKTKK